MRATPNDVTGRLATKVADLLGLVCPWADWIEAVRDSPRPRCATEISSGTRVIDPGLLLERQMPVRALAVSESRANHVDARGARTTRSALGER